MTATASKKAPKSIKPAPIAPDPAPLWESHGYDLLPVHHPSGACRLELAIRVSLDGPAAAALLKNANAKIDEMRKRIREALENSAEYKSWSQANRRLSEMRRKTSALQTEIQRSETDLAALIESDSAAVDDARLSALTGAKADASSRLNLLSPTVDGLLQKERDAARALQRLGVDTVHRETNRIFTERETAHKTLCGLLTAHEALGEIVVSAQSGNLVSNANYAGIIGGQIVAELLGGPLPDALPMPILTPHKTGPTPFGAPTLPTM